MINEASSKKAKRKIALAAALIGAVLVIAAIVFARDVREQLWKQSVETIMESTQQGCNTLRVQLRDECESLGTFIQYVRQVSSEDRDTLEELLGNYSAVDAGVGLYLSDGSSFPSDFEADETVQEELGKLGGEDERNGIIAPHISSVTGINVFDLYVKVTFKDGTTGFLVKEYEIDSIVDTFTVSFYNDTGFSYVINGEGNVLIRPPHPNSNKTVKNLFDMLPKSENDPAMLEEFSQALADGHSGWAVFNYQGEDAVFCYTPLKLQTDWLLVSIIPKDVVDAQTDQILLRTFVLIIAILAGIVLLVSYYLRYTARTNKKLNSQAEYISHLYNAVPEGIALLSVDRPFRCRQLNQEGLRILGYSGEVLEGTGLDKVICPEDYDMVEEVLQDTVDNNRKNIFENRILREDGSFFWVGSIAESTLDDNGEPILIVAFHDITEQKMAEQEAEREQLQERTMLVGAISNVYPVIIILNLSDDSLKFIYVRPGLLVNLGEQTTYSRLYKDFVDTVHPDSRGEFRERFAPDSLKKALESGKTEVFLEAKQKLMDGVYHWTSTQIIHVENPYSNDKLAILISRRIDEQRHEEEQKRQMLQTALDNARAASEAKSRFLSNMSHDIRTPMNAIIGMAAIASTHLEDQKRVRECLQKIGLSSKHLLSLINDVLDMSKIESGKLSFREEPFNFAELIAEVVELVRPQADAGQLQLDIQMSALKDEKVIGDPLRIRQVYINILSNAVKYTLPGGSIRIEIEQVKSSVKEYQRYIFRCIDSGIGMSREFLGRLFQPFERSRDSADGKIAGTGLGMAITKNLVDLMSGEITVESALGEGSVFTVSLPLRLQEAGQENVPEEWMDIHTLIVDDDRQMCENAAELLKDMGLRPQFVTEGAAAVREVVAAKDTEDPFELAIIDWKMPDMDGIEVTRRIRKEVGPDVPVIILSAYDWGEIEYEARMAGVTAFLAKPFYRSKICYVLSELSGEKTSVPYEEEQAEPYDYSGMRILLVEDNAMNREIAHTLLTEMGLLVEEACDGKEAVSMMKKCEEGYYQLIFMDIQMPNMDGYEAARAIRALNRSDAREVPIIAMTANAFEEDVQAALRAGMNAHFAKPIDVEALGQLLHRYLVGEP